MDATQRSNVVSFLWGIDDHVLRNQDAPLRYLDLRKNLSPHPVKKGAGNHPGLDNHAMGMMDRIASQKLPLPPLAEQVESECSQLKVAQDRGNEVALLREHRTRLIAGVVTGTLDVREAIADLPDELDTDEPEFDEADDLEDTDDLPDVEADE